MLAFLKRACTGPDNTTPDLALSLTAAGVIFYLLHSAVSLWALGQQWDPMAFGGGLAAIIGTGALGGRINRWTQPRQE